MQTTLDCLPCLLKQALYTVRLSIDDEAGQWPIVEAAARLLSSCNASLSPPENATALYDLIAERSGCADPFAELKAASNRQALALAPMARERIEAAAEPLRTAILFAVAGNVIDYGAHHRFDIDRTIDECQARELAIDHFRQFRADLERADTVLYLADNCGELVFDALLLERMGKKATVAVKERPIINDATLSDAAACGVDRVATVISNGTGCPGTPLADCSPELRAAFESADLIISKGQGNFETLSETAAPIYFLLTVKCPVVVRHLADIAGPFTDGLEEGDMVLLRHPRFPG